MECYQAVHLSMSVRLHARIWAKRIGQIYVKFDTWVFIKICRSIPSFLLKKRRNIGHFTCITKHVLLLPATVNYNELFSNDMVPAR